MKKSKKEEEFVPNKFENSESETRAKRFYGNELKEAIGLMIYNYKIMLDSRDIDFSDLTSIIFEVERFNSLNDTRSVDSMIDLQNITISTMLSYKNSSDSVPELTNRALEAEQKYINIVNSASWKTFVKIHSFLSKLPKLKLFIKRILKICYWTYKRTLINNIKLYINNRRRLNDRSDNYPSFERVEIDSTPTNIIHSGKETDGTHIRFVPKISVILYGSHQEMEHQISNILKHCRSEWELVILGSPSDWKISHSLLRYIAVDSKSAPVSPLDGILEKTFGKAVVVVGNRKPSEPSTQLHGLHELDDCTQAEVAVLREIINSATDESSRAYIQHVYSRV